jgi:WD40 repeat protein
MKWRRTIGLGLSALVLLAWTCDVAPGQEWSVELYDVHIEDPAGLLDRTNAQAVAFMPDGKTVVTAGSSYQGATKEVRGEVRLRRAEDGALVATLGRDGISYAGRAGAMAVAPSGRLIAAIGFTKNGDRMIDIFDPMAMKLVRTLQGHRYVITSVAFSPDGKLLAAAHGDGTVEVWDSENGKSMSSFSARIGIGPISFSPDGRMLATGNDNGSVSFWDPTTGANLGDILAPTDLVNIGSVAFSPDGRLLAAGGHSEGIRENSPVYLWELTATDSNHVTAKQKAKFEGQQMHTYSLTFSLDGSLLACANQDSTATVWNVQEGSLAARITQHRDFVYDVAFSPNGETLITLGRDAMKSWSMEQLLRAP